MLDRLNPFRPPEHSVLSLAVQAQLPQDRREQSRFEVLVRHLLDRFLNNELMSSDGETKRAILLAYVIAWLGLVVAMYLFPVYHQPVKRPFWSMVDDHYFFVMYSMVVMGIVTVYEWDLLFPNLLDVFVLSVLPLEDRKLFLARVLALVIFFALVLFGTNCLSTIFLPLVSDEPGLLLHLFAHAAAVLMGGLFTAALFLSLQGLLLNLLGQRMFQRITPLLQGASITILLTVLFLYPTLSRSLHTLLNSSSTLVRCFPPFWFLGIYERLLAGSSTLPIFKQLSTSACWATLLTVTLAIVTYPLAYKRKVRQLIEGGGVEAAGVPIAHPLNKILHATIVRSPASRAVFHFVSQTLLRTQKHRVLLSMYAGLGIALALAEMISFTLTGDRVHVNFETNGIRCAVPILIFWTVAGLQTALTSPMDRRGSWLFRVVIGRANLGHLNGAKIWVALWGFAVGVAALSLLHRVTPATLETPFTTTARIVVAFGLGLLLTDCLFLNTTAIPFTELRKTALTDMPLAVIRYCVVFPALVLIAVHLEQWSEISIKHLIAITFAIAMTHLFLSRRYEQDVQEMRSGSDFEEGDPLFQQLGLRD
jgi:hypothetical protein